MSEKVVLRDEELSKVTGGGYVIKNSGTYSSEGPPKFCLNQRVQIEKVSSHPSQPSVWVDFYVTAVSQIPDGGTFFKEYTYTLKGVSSNLVIEGVYESCIRAA